MRISAAFLALVLVAGSIIAPQTARAAEATRTEKGTTPASEGRTLDPVKDCPAGFVCYTIGEDAAATLECERIAAERNDLRRRRLFARFAEAGATYGTGGPGAYARTGFRLGPIQIGAGVHGDSDGTALEAFVGARWEW